MELTKTPVAKTGMLIRKPVDEVFEAFVDPALTSQFWFSKGSARLEEGKQVEWTWEWYGFSVPVTVKKVEQNRLIVFGWPTEVQWIFTPHEQGTYVDIVCPDFSGTGDEMAQQAIDTAEGFSFVLAGAKAFLEHGINLNLVPDRFPDGLPPH